MLRSGFLLGVGGPAAILTLLVLPSVRASADRLVPVQSAASPTVQTPYLPGARPASLSISPVHGAPVHVATMPRSESRSAPALPSSIGTTASEKEMLPKPRRMTREGCEAPLSSLVGPEARRMVPGRCMA
ncbi:hypothetical protein FV217_13630 [Methylobacterium sp. WL9]|nr:hypothetical protein FV217_13630 [Methylobacterium sp. WL9]